MGLLQRVIDDWQAESYISIEKLECSSMACWQPGTRHFLKGWQMTMA